MRDLLKILAGFVILVSLPLLAWKAAAAQDAEESFVWGITADLGNRYLGLFSPAQVPDLYLLAGQEHILSGKQTYVYYWPIDHEYKADWTRLNRDISGTLEILDESGKTVQTLKQEWYLLRSHSEPDAGDGQAQADLVTGEAALAAYEDYQSRREAYLNMVKQYDRDLKAYLDQLNQMPSQQLPPPPAPATFTDVVQKPKQGFVVKLSPGRYTARMLDEAGSVIPESHRTLWSVAPQRQGVGLVIIPEDRWTRPEKSFEASSPIYFTKSGTTVYLQPVSILEYNERDFARLTNPQEKVSSPNRRQWVQGKPISGAALQLWIGNRLEQTINSEGFTVQQNPGYALGYQIMPFDAAKSQKPDFEAYKLPLSGAVRRYTLRLTNDQGRVIPGSERIIQPASRQLPGTILLLLLGPLVAGAAIKINRSVRKIQSTKEIEKLMTG